MFITTMNTDSKVGLFIKKFIVIAVVSAILLTSVFSVAALNKIAVVNVDGKQIQLETISSDTDYILSEAGIELNNADVVICVSENTRKDLLHYLPNIDNDKIRVVHNGVSNDFYKLEDGQIATL